METIISKNNKLVTLINVFTVEPEHQQEVLDILVDATEKVMKHLPGFISANLHKSLDGNRVANYAQWESKEAFETMLQDPQVKPHMAAVAKLAQIEPYLYEVSHVDHR